MNRYDDIIEIKYEGVRFHKRMDMANRASQFAPFAALNGHSEAISETARKNNESMDFQ